MEERDEPADGSTAQDKRRIRDQSNTVEEGVPVVIKGGGSDDGGIWELESAVAVDDGCGDGAVEALVLAVSSLVSGLVDIIF